ncbi:MAG TPA: toll/interleukin-1 receptor domain-containing protein [Bryobacteraceae bacterium]|nr:toll/interleukin-1 receptor domain-containing protein [Bryobacteraceae bacterium]
MGAVSRSSEGQVAHILRQCLRDGRRVEIDGLGVFLPDRRCGFRFLARTQPKVFLAYVQEDGEILDALFDALKLAGFDPWMDRRKLLPGQNWPRSIEEAIETSDFFIPCFSHQSVTKKGGFQAEIRYALDCARRVPLDQIFLIPARLDDCRVPARIQKEWQYLDLFPDWDRGLRKLFSVMRRQIAHPASGKNLKRRGGSSHL